MSNITDIVFEDDRWQEADFEALANRAAAAVVSYLHVPVEDPEVAILACGDTRIAELNTQFRGKATPTNVLSWPSEDLAPTGAGDAPQTPRDPELGDIAISYDTCAREASEMGKDFHDHVTHLVIHGILHLLGFDHIRDPDATLMEETERRILGTLGIDDPY